MASTYVAGGDLEYGRYANPTWAAFEEALGALEGGRALAFSSGLAAVSTVLDLVGQDALVVAPRHAYLGSIGQLGDLEARGRVKALLVDIADTAAVIAALTRPDGAPSSGSSRRPTPPSRWPTSRRSCGPATRPAPGSSSTTPSRLPSLQRPLELGADIVLHSVTKFLAGHSDVVMGALVVRDPQLYDVLKGRRDLVGAIPGTLEAWLALRGLRTLHLRVERSQANAIELARRLESHPAIESVRYPGFGAIVAAVLPTAEAADLLTHSTVAVGARHLARQCRVDVRTPPALEGRGRDHPRGPRPDVRRHRGRRRPLGRPRLEPTRRARSDEAGRPAPADRPSRVSRSRPWCRGR